ncbi:MAG: peptidylprolyl isomerase [Spirochaetes bacterium]|nr:peptidylprolyl isomerase [Spirochaetota bacterium]
MDIQKGKVVSIDYILRDTGGKLLDSSDEGDPLVYLHGNDNIIPGLEKQLEGKKSGDKLSCVVPAVEAYGERNEELVLKVSKKEFSPDAEVTPGMQFEAQSEEGSQIVTVMKIAGDEVTIDANHPLAGETLHFQVSVVDVREATAEELEHGHVHGHDACECGCGEGDCGDECSCGDGTYGAKACSEGCCD